MYRDCDFKMKKTGPLWFERKEIEDVSPLQSTSRSAWQSDAKAIWLTRHFGIEFGYVFGPSGKRLCLLG